MMYKKANEKSRHQLANPYQKTPFKKRLKMNKSVDLRNNFCISDHNNGYITINPIDKNKTFK